jgi:hypothetical protein
MRPWFCTIVGLILLPVALGMMFAGRPGGNVHSTVHFRRCHLTGSSPSTYRPDPRCTPGALNPAVTEATIYSTICKKGWTVTVRPPESYTNRVKAADYRLYGLMPGTVSELDHLIPLELGGAPSDTRNLWPELGAMPNPKDTVENELRSAVCSGRVSLRVAQQAIARNWTTAEQELGL